MSKYHYSVEPKQNSYAPSADYGRVFGWKVLDASQDNKTVATYLLHETGSMIARFPLSKKCCAWIEKVARENGFTGNLYY